MKSSSRLGKKIVMGVALLVLAGWLSLATAPAEAPLSKDDITLLLLGSSPSSKIIQIVEQRGVDFQMNPDLAKTFHDQGASDDLIDALRKAGNKAAAAKASGPAAPAPTPPAAANPNSSPAAEPSLTGKPNAPDAPEPPAAEAPSGTPSTPTAPAIPATSTSSDEPVLHTRHSADADGATSASAPASAPAPGGPSLGSSSASEPVMHQAAKKEAPPETPVTASAPGLKDPDAQGIQHIIQEFAAKEKIFQRGPQQLHLPPDQ